MPQQPVLRTDRLTLRPARSADGHTLHRLWDDPLVRRYLFDDMLVTQDAAAALLAKCLRHAGEGCGLWLILAGADQEVVGCAGLLPATVAAQFEPRLAGQCELLAALRPSAWHRGYATEALAALRDHAFGTLRLPALVAVNDLPNQASARMLRRLGFSLLSEVAGPAARLQTYQLLAPAPAGHAGGEWRDTG